MLAEERRELELLDDGIQQLFRHHRRDAGLEAGADRLEELPKPGDEIGVAPEGVADDRHTLRGQRGRVARKPELFLHDLRALPQASSRQQRLQLLPVVGDAAAPQELNLARVPDRLAGDHDPFPVEDNRVVFLPEINDPDRHFSPFVRARQPIPK